MPGLRVRNTGGPPRNERECIYFVDGLRFDVARRLSKMLLEAGLRVEETALWAAIPSVTATGKPAVTPVAHLIHGQDIDADFEPCVVSTGQSLKGGYYLQKLLAEEGSRVPRQIRSRSMEGLGVKPAISVVEATTEAGNSLSIWKRCWGKSLTELNGCSLPDSRI